MKKPQPFIAADTSLLQPLLPKTAGGCNNSATEISNSGILFRLFFVLLVVVISVWANREASKGFGVTIINDAKDSPHGKKFALFYQSDDTATRVLLNASSFVEKFLYHGVPHCHRKPVNHVTVRFSGNNSVGDQRLPVASGTSDGEFVISLCSSLMKDRDFGYIVTSVLQRAMVKIWLWGADAGAPPQLVDGMAEYIAAAAGFGGEDSSQPSDQILLRLEQSGGSHGCWVDKDPALVAKFLGYCDGLSEGFIQRLNQAMRQPWDDWTVDIAFGTRREGACDSYKEALRGLKMRQANN